MQSCRTHELFISLLQTYMTCKTKHAWACRSRVSKIGVISNKFDFRCLNREEEKKCISRRKRDADTYIRSCVSAASKDLKIRSKITSVSILVQNILTADLRSIDEEKIKTREAHRRRDSKVYSVYLLYYYFFLSYSITSLFLLIIIIIIIIAP